ncbi:MAG: Gfo/Idh/MocA family oxidoreductase [Thermodesulfobacteriota bacterium]|nr:Gfo/Idh/MocA family oxidoreductase [Thermodesulfobacteriota bacterium]
MLIGIIGTGKHGSRYANHIVHDIDGLELAAISRRSKKGKVQADRWQCSWYADWQQLVADERVEALISAVPPSLNLSIAHSCAAYNKPLLLEKPLADSAGAAAEIVNLYRERNLPLTTGQTLRYNQVIRTLKKKLPGLGTLHSFSANQRLEPSTLSWHKQPELAGAGVSFHTAVHVFDALCYITGRDIVRVMAVTGSNYNAVLEDLLLVLVELDNGVKGTVDCSKVARARSGRFEFVCSDGQLVGDQVHNSCALTVGMDIHPVDCGEPVGTIIPLLKDWQRFLSGRGDNPISGADGLRAVQICAACLKSARRASWVDVT